MKPSEISKIFTEGKKIYTKTFKIVYLPTSDVGEVIISAPIKMFPRAVDRNRIKRLIRESIRDVDFLNKNVFIIYNSPDIKSLKDMKSELENIKL